MPTSLQLAKLPYNFKVRLTSAALNPNIVSHKVTGNTDVEASYKNVSRGHFSEIISFTGLAMISLALSLDTAARAAESPSSDAALSVERELTSTSSCVMFVPAQGAYV